MTDTPAQSALDEEALVAKYKHKAHLELTAGIIRVYGPGKSHDAGDKYEWCGVVVNFGRGKAEIRGVMNAPTLAHARAIQTCLREAGFTKLEVERWQPAKDDEPEHRWVRKHERAEQAAGEE